MESYLSFQVLTTSSWFDKHVWGLALIVNSNGMYAIWDFRDVY